MVQTVGSQEGLGPPGTVAYQGTCLTPEPMLGAVGLFSLGCKRTVPFCMGFLVGSELTAPRPSGSGKPWLGPRGRTCHLNDGLLGPCTPWGWTHPGP